MSMTYVLGDPRDVLPRYADATFAVCVTSPPYFARRSYGLGDREIGAGTLDGYIADLRATFVEVRRVLRPDGLLWLNLGDSSVGSGGSGGDYYNKDGPYAGRERYRAGAGAFEVVGVRLPKYQWADVPSRVVHALQADGWRLRSRVVWAKPSPRRAPKAHERRPGEQHEMIFMLSRTARPSGYRYFPERESEPGDVWQFERSSGSFGKAPFPVELPRRCIAVSTEPDVGDQVLDPFGGSGATAIAARECGCDSTLIDLDMEAQSLAAIRYCGDGIDTARTAV